ncbi:MAG: sigma-54-dependent Fis family transcriptional regulator [Candidatus Glassbacteria bacterium]|nr:sigma-54-dependent Fis family transcriptional regulator [Candidatus Glassbacteria bacterium]
MNRILIIDDEQSLLTTLEMLFSKEGYEVRTACGGRDGLLRLSEGDRPDLLISDVKMPEVDGIQVLRAAKKMDPCLPVVLITAHADLRVAKDACNEGAYYFLEKPFRNKQLLEICREALAFGKADRRYSDRKRELSSARRPEMPVGEAPCFKAAMELATKAAESDSTILIQGENGTGKEIVARFIYRSSRRGNRPFITVNCGALQDTLLESELFGHVKGSFTGAISNKDGLFKVASGGTILLDEVGDTSLSLQVKLLRVLQEKEITPVGSTEPVPVDVRVIAATNRKLEDHVREGRFREDLFYRLNVIPITVPPLRERSGDIPLLIDYFLKRNSIEGDHRQLFSGQALELLESYHWPGNVRELENVIERLCVLGHSAKISEKDLPEEMRRPRVAPLAGEDPKPTPTLEAVEKAYIHWVMEQVGGSKTRAAKILGIDPSTLYRKLPR